MRKDSILFRENEERLISNYLLSKTFTSKNLFIHGSSGTGKSTVLEHVLSGSDKKLIHVTVDTAEFTSMKNIYLWNSSTKFVLELILSQFCVQVNFPKRRLHSLFNFKDFIKTLGQIFDYHTTKHSDCKYAIIFDTAEKFLNIKFELFQFFYKLSEFLEEHHQLCCVFISNLPSQYFYSNTFYIEPYCIEFPRYTNEQIEKILLSQRPAMATEKLYATYIDTFLKVCLPVTNNIDELLSLSKLNFNEFLLKSKSLDEADVWTQWKIIQPVLKKNLSKIHAKFRTTSDGPSNASFNQLEMPLMTRYLLISAFIASFNLSSSDKRFFVQNTGKMSSRMKKVDKRNEKTDHRFNVPKIFPLDRLISIYRSITSLEDLPYTIMAQSQISSLCKIGLLVMSSSDSIGTTDSADKLMNPKYRCLAPFELVESIAKPIDFKLRAYLTDFV